MTDIPLEKAQIVWTLMDGAKGPTLRVVGGDVKDDERYISSWGACNGEFSAASDADKIRMLLAESINLTLNENISPKLVHEALMVIPEYRQALAESGVIRPLDDE